uniref:Uncharacterized protein n=1 Tax=Trichuris muris TaxID=70415 RepID=A0A5S6Q9L3_TRIMR
MSDDDSRLTINRKKDDMNANGLWPKRSPMQPKLDEWNSSHSRGISRQLKSMDWNKVIDQQSRTFSPRKEGPPLHVAWTAMKVEKNSNDTAKKQDEENKAMNTTGPGKCGK